MVSSHSRWARPGSRSLSRQQQIHLVEGFEAGRPTIQFFTPIPMLSLLTTASDQQEGDKGSSPFTFIVTRTGNTSVTSSAQWAVSGTGANRADSDDFRGGRFPSGIVRFRPGETTKVIKVPVADDRDVESDESFGVFLF
jgi:hypothetical protein